MAEEFDILGPAALCTELFIAFFLLTHTYISPNLSLLVWHFLTGLDGKCSFHRML